MSKRLVAALTTVLELAGVALIVWGLWLWLVPVALVVAGLACIALSFFWTRGGNA